MAASTSASRCASCCSACKIRAWRAANPDPAFHDRTPDRAPLVQAGERAGHNLESAPPGSHPGGPVRPASRAGSSRDLPLANPGEPRASARGASRRSWPTFCATVPEGTGLRSHLAGKSAQNII
jgi:hypothetical protein